MNLPRQTRLLRWVGGLSLSLVVVLSYLTATSPVAKALREGGMLSGVVMGTDRADHSPHSDTLMVWLYHPTERRLDLLSIPRDTKINLPGYRFGRINEVFAYHYGQGKDRDLAAVKVCEAVGHLFSCAGVNLVPPHFIQVDYEGFRRVIDQLGGVTVSVDEPMDYDDNAGDFHVHLATGIQHLNGDDALGFVRFRGRSGDRGRILRQMEFVHALLKRVASPEIVVRGPRAIVELYRTVRTNLSAIDLLLLFVEGRNVTSEKLNTVLLPGSPRGALWEMNVERAGYVFRQLVRVPVGTGDLSPHEGKTDSVPEDRDYGLDTSGEESDETLVPSGPVTVKVWNASGKVGLANAVSRKLRSLGFDVVDYGNYNARQKKSRVIDRSGFFGRAGSVAKALGLTSLYSDADPSLRTDVEIILGEDFTKEHPDGND